MLTILLGLTFTSVQAYEYAHAPFAFKGSIYGSTFFMATGFHGFHVIVGTIFLTVCLIRCLQGRLHAEAAFRLRGGRLVLAFRRRRVAVPVHVDLRLGRLGRAARALTPGPPMREKSALANALAGNCPRCGAHSLFDGWVRFAHRCRNCGLDYDSFNVGDGPAAFLIFIVGAIVVVGALVLDAAAEPPWWVHLIWIPVTAGADHRRVAARQGRRCSRRNIRTARAKGGSANDPPSARAREPRRRSRPSRC